MHEDKTAQMIGQTIQRVGKKTSHSLDKKPQYQVQALLGRQSGRRTFLAIASDTQQPVVVKLLLFGPDFTWEDLKLFEREAETLKSLSHPAIPKYLDSFEVETPIGKGFVLVQTYIEARSLREWAIAGRRFSEAELKEIAQSLLEILQYLHSRSPAVVHRDIKPSNVLLSESSPKKLRQHTAHSVGKVYLIDFGSVQTVAHDGTITVVGTYGYMPPEQFGGRAVPASDLYSLAMTIVYLMLGKHPSDLVRQRDRLNLAGTNFSTHFIEWIQRLTATDLSRRIASVEDATRRLTNSKIDDKLAQSNRLSRQELVQNGLRVSATGQELSIRFGFERLGGTPIKMLPKQDADGMSCGAAILIFILVCIFPVLIIVGVAFVVLKVLAAIVESFFSIFDKQPYPRFHHSDAVILNLHTTSSGSKSLSLTLFRNHSRSVDLKENKHPEPLRYLDNVRLEGVQVGEIPDSKNRYYIGFLFESTNSERMRRVYVRGDKSEIALMRDMIAEWGMCLGFDRGKILFFMQDALGEKWKR